MSVLSTTDGQKVVLSNQLPGRQGCVCLKAHVCGIWGRYSEELRSQLPRRGGRRRDGLTCGVGSS